MPSGAGLDVELFRSHADAFAEAICRYAEDVTSPGRKGAL